MVLVRKTKIGGRDRLECLDDNGVSRLFLMSWTNYPTDDLYRVLMEKASMENVDFRFEDMNALASLLASFKKCNPNYAGM